MTAKKNKKNIQNKIITRVIGAGLVMIKQDIGQNQRKEHFFDAFDVITVESGSTATTGQVRLARGPNATMLSFCDESAGDVANRIMAHKIQFAASESLNQMSKNSLHRMVELICASVLLNLDATIEEMRSEVDEKQVAEMVKTVLIDLAKQEKSDPAKPISVE